MYVSIFLLRSLILYGPDFNLRNKFMSENVKLHLHFLQFLNNDFGASFLYLSSRRRGKHPLILHIQCHDTDALATHGAKRSAWCWKSYVRILLFLHQKYLIVGLSLDTQLIYFASKYISIFSISLKIQVFTKYVNSLWCSRCHIPVPCHSTDVVTAKSDYVGLHKTLHHDPRHYVTC